MKIYSKWTDLILCFVWIVALITFGWQGDDAYKQISVSLTRYDFSQIKTFSNSNGNNLYMQASGITLEDLFNSLGNTYNSNVVALEKSIQDSAKTTLSIDLLSFFAALLGLIAQITEYRRKK